MTDERSDRRACAQRVRDRAPAIAEMATEQFLRNHPDWVDRYGDRARTRGVEDARFHAEFLAGAIALGSEDAFRDYVRWAAGMLDARGIAPRFLAENLQQVHDAAVALLPGDAGLMARYSRAGIESCSSAPGPAAPTGDEAVTVYREAAVAGRRTAAVTVAREALAASSLVDVYADLLEPAQRQVGELWAAGAITVAQEHMATAITQFVTSTLMSELGPPQDRRGRAVVTGVAGERHQLGAAMVADALASDGWRMRFLGTDLPHEDIAALLERERPDLIGISATLTANVPAAVDLIARVRARLGAECPSIIVGGRAAVRAPSASALGADMAPAGVRDAVITARDASVRRSGE